MMYFYFQNFQRNFECGIILKTSNYFNAWPARHNPCPCIIDDGLNTRTRRVSFVAFVFTSEEIYKYPQRGRSKSVIKSKKYMTLFDINFARHI